MKETGRLKIKGASAPCTKGRVCSVESVYRSARGSCGDFCGDFTSALACELRERLTDSAIRGSHRVSFYATRFENAQESRAIAP